MFLLFISKRRVPLVGQELDNFSEDPGFSGVRVSYSLFFCVLWTIVCLFVRYLLGIFSLSFFDLRLPIFPFVSSNFNDKNYSGWTSIKVNLLYSF